LLDGKAITHDPRIASLAPEFHSLFRNPAFLGGMTASSISWSRPSSRIGAAPPSSDALADRRRWRRAEDVLEFFGLECVKDASPKSLVHASAQVRWRGAVTARPAAPAR